MRTAMCNALLRLNQATICFPSIVMYTREIIRHDASQLNRA